ncbi:MAG: glycosyl transferase, family 9 [Conexibacter sp.]|nr:glycosyl transferase, family 9 [Conexibacter sp.]
MSRHVLLARLDNDGDVLLTGPAIRAVAAAADRVTLLCGPRGAAAAALLPGVDDVIVHRAEWIDPDPVPFDPAPTLALVERLRALAPEEAIVFGSFHQSPLPLALILRLAGVPLIGATSVDFPGTLLDVRHAIDDDVHEVERALDLVDACGYALPPGDDGRLRVRRGDPEPPFAAGRPYLVMHPGASVPARAWAPERCAELVAALVAQGRRVAVTGAPGERELTAFVAAAPAGEDGGAVRDLGGTTSFAELAGVLAGADAIVVGNTGPAHLAAAVGTPVVSLFAPTVPPVRWRPWQVPHELLSIDVPCAGCRERTCPVAGHPCIDALPLDAVLDAVERLAPAAGGPARRSAVLA